MFTKFPFAYQRVITSGIRNANQIVTDPSWKVRCGSVQGDYMTFLRKSPTDEKKWFVDKDKAKRP